LVLDAAEAELALCLQAQAADRQQDPHASVPVPVWLELMSLFSNDAPMLVCHAVWYMRQTNEGLDYDVGNLHCPPLTAMLGSKHSFSK
jgi:hypothetical protein